MKLRSFIIISIIFFAVFCFFKTDVFAGIITDNIGETAKVANLKNEGDITQIVGTVVNGALGFLGVLFLMLIFYAGIVWTVSGKNAEDVEKAKDIMGQAVLGLIITFLAYAIASYVFTIIGGVTK
ncbi:MAG: hypothetical protein WCT18_04435 [Patescibacteria group bacterium]